MNTTLNPEPAAFSDCLGTAAMLVRGSDRRAWLAAFLLPLGASAVVRERTAPRPRLVLAKGGAH